MRDLKPLQAIQQPLLVGLKILAVFMVLQLALTPVEYLQYSRIPGTQRVLDVNLWSDWLLGVPAILEPFALIGVLVLFFMWVYRATKNLRALTDYPMRQRPGWSVGWYFVPIACLFKPYEGMSDIWNAVEADGGKGLRLSWWLTVLGSSFAARASDGGIDVTVAEAQRQFLPDMVMAVFAVAMVILTHVLVSRIGTAYARNVREWQLDTPPVPSGWYDDPSGSSGHRYWDGERWTDAVDGPDAAPGSHGGSVQQTDRADGASAI